MPDALSDLLQERRWLFDRLSKIDELIEKNHKLPGTGENVATEQKRSTKIRRGIRENGAGWILAPTPMNVFEGRLKSVLADSHRPLKRRELLRQLEDQKVVIPGRDPLNTLSTRLTRIVWVMNVKGHGYWPVNRDYKPAQALIDSHRNMIAFIVKAVAENTSSVPMEIKLSGSSSWQ